MHANHREEISDLVRRGYCRRRRAEGHHDGDTLCDEKHPIILESMVFPDPVISVAIEPKTKADQDKMAMALSNWRRKIPPSVPTPTGDGSDHHLPGWANCTWMSSSTG